MAYSPAGTPRWTIINPGVPWFGSGYPASIGIDSTGAIYVTTFDTSVGTLSKYSKAVADTDGDGVSDTTDNCPNVANPGQANAVHPLTTAGDACEDPDADGVVDAADNCPDSANANQLNTDGDAMGNACDPDDDNDGLLDVVETNTGVFVDATNTGTDPLKADTDGDGCGDGKEAGPDHGAGGERDPNSKWDFFDVPAPALRPSNMTGTRDKIIKLSDVLADLQYVGTSAAMPGTPNANGAMYGSDLNGNGIADGVEYDRTPSTTPGQPWRSGPPNGTVTLGDVLTVLAQVGTNCN